MQPAEARQLRIQQAEAAYQRRIRRARGDLATFIEMAGKDENGAPLVLHELHRSWIWHLHYAWSHGKHAGIMSPFGGGKSSTLAIPLACYMVGRNPQVRLKFLCAGDDLAARRVRSCKTIIESEEYRQIFPGVIPGDRWTDHDLVVRRRGHAPDPTVEARGVNTKGIGTRADGVFFDDICDQQNTLEEASRRKTKLFARGTWMSRLDGPTALAMMIATAWHVDDATHDFLHDPDWCFLVQRVSQDKTQYDQEVYNAGPDYLDKPGPGYVLDPDPGR